MFLWLYAPYDALATAHVDSSIAKYLDSYVLLTICALL